MITTLRLSKKELYELLELTNKTDPSAAVRLAMVEYIRYAKRMRLKKLAGKVTMQNNWQEFEQREMDSQNGQSGSH